MDKKKGWLLLGAAILILVIIGIALCATSKEQNEEKLPLIGLCLRQYEEDPTLGQRLEQRLKEAGYRVCIADAGNDQVKQNHQITAFVEESAVLLVVEPVITDTVKDVITSLKSPNVPVVFVNYLPEEDVLQMWDRFSCIYSLEESLGAQQGKVILETKDRGDKNKDGQVSCLVIAGPEDDRFAVDQAHSCVRNLEEGGQTVCVVDIVYTDGTKEKSLALCNKALAQYGKDIEVIFCGNEATTLGMLEAANTSGWQAGRDFYVVGAGIEQVVDSNFTAIVAEDMDTFLDNTCDAAMNLLNGKTTEQVYYVNYKTITPEG